VARSITSAFRAELAAGSCRPCFLLDFQTSGGWVKVWTGGRDISWNSYTWLGNGLFRSPGQLESNSDDMPGMRITFAGESSEIVSLAQSGFKNNYGVLLYLGFLNSSHAIIADPDLLFTGNLDGVELVDDKTDSSLFLSYRSDLAALYDSNIYRYTHETQQIFYPGDLGFEYMQQMNDLQLYWGKPEQKNDKEKKAKPPKGKNKNPKKRGK